MSKHVYRVSYRAGCWYVHELEISRVTRGYRDRHHAIARAVELAKNNRPSIVCIEDTRGAVETERTFGDASLA